jgi:hypothetical protein
VAVEGELWWRIPRGGGNGERYREVVAGTSDGSSSRDNGRCPITMTTVEGAWQQRWRRGEGCRATVVVVEGTKQHWQCRMLNSNDKGEVCWCLTVSNN